MPDLLQKLLEALGKKYSGGACPLDSMEKIPENAQMLGYVPEHLRQLHVLCKNMKDAQTAERHRRCVDLFGREEYDNEQVEFMIYNEVNADPDFGGDGVIERLFDWSLSQHFPQIPISGFGNALYSLGPNWEVYLPAVPVGRPLLFPFGVIIDKK